MKSNHNHSIVSSQLNQGVNKFIKNEIRRIVHEERNTSLFFIKSHLKKVMKNQGIVASRKCRSFFPNNRTLYNYVLKYSYEKKGSKIDQEAVALKIDHWSQTGKVYYRRYRKSDGLTEPFLFCYQSDENEDMIISFGSVLLLDATYKTTQYSLPLFLLVIKTNVNYCPVGFFVVQNEDSKSIAEALSVFRSWNPNWLPQYILVDYSEAEINAINSTFQQQVKIKICAFHREQAWERWTKKTGNLVESTHKKEILQLWRKVAESENAANYQQNLDLLNSNKTFLANTKAQTYFNNTWLKVKEMWVVAFFDFDFLVNITTNNGIESQNRLLKHSYLKSHSDKSLTNILDIMIGSYLPTTLEQYEIQNSKMSENYKKYNEEIPLFLRNRPYQFVKHVCRRYRDAEDTFSNFEELITVVGDGIFEVQSDSKSNTQYQVNWREPSCKCYDFMKHKLPCKHMCAIMIFIPGYSFDTLPADYINNPFFNLNMSRNLFETNFMEIEVLGEENIVTEGETNMSGNKSQTDDYSNSAIDIDIRLLREQAKLIIDMSYNINTDRRNLSEEIKTNIQNGLGYLKATVRCLDNCVKKDDSLVLLPKKRNVSTG